MPISMFSYKSVLEALVNEVEEKKKTKTKRQKGIKRRNKTSLFTYTYVFKYKQIINSHFTESKNTTCFKDASLFYLQLTKTHCQLN